MRITTLLCTILVFGWVGLAKAEAIQIVEPSVTTEIPIVEIPLSERELAEQWAYEFMTRVSPPGRKTYYPEGQETKQDGELRYRSIASDLISVVFSPQTKVPFTGPIARARTTAVMLSVMFHESGFMKHVDYGLGKYARGDKGRSWCMMQLNIGDGTTTPWNIRHNRAVQKNDPPEEVFPGYTGDELIQDRRKCLSEGLKVLTRSFKSCRDNTLDHRLAAYASGACDKGLGKSEERMGMAIRWFHKSRDLRRFKDANVVLEVARLEQEVVPETLPEKVSISPDT